MKYRFYILSLFDGSYLKTNNEETAKNYARCEDCYVLDTELDKMIVAVFDDDEDGVDGLKYIELKEAGVVDVQTGI